MNPIRFNDATAFHQRVTPFLMQEEAANCMILGNATRPTEITPLMALVEDAPDGEIRAVVKHIMGRPLILSTITHSDQTPANIALYSALVDVVHDYDATIPGCMGPKEVVLTFSEAWRARTGRNFTPVMEQRIYKVEQVIPPAGVPGQLRMATQADRETLAQFGAHFTAETFHREPDYAMAATLVDKHLADPNFTQVIWEVDGQPVTTAYSQGPTPNGIRISGVYTPPEHRRKGYGSACTAALSQLHLGQGRTFCALYTDLSNPTSNHIYRQIGYRPVLDSLMLRFEKPETTQLRLNKG